MDKDYLSIIESIFGDIRDNNDNSDLVAGLLSQLKCTINDFFASVKKSTDDWLISDYTTLCLNRIYASLDNPKYNDISVNISECVDALSKYKEYLEGLEEYITTVFSVQADDNIGVDNIKDKNCFVFDKNENYINGLFTYDNPDATFDGVPMSISDATREFEVVLEFITHLESFRVECISLTGLLNQEYKTKTNSELFLLKLSSSSIYIYSVFCFISRLSREIRNNVDSIQYTIERVDNPREEAPKTYKMF